VREEGEEMCSGEGAVVDGYARRWGWNEGVRRGCRVAGHGGPYDEGEDAV
jgi:hypothetical protein